MDILSEHHVLAAEDIRDKWQILNIFLGSLNSEGVDCKILRNRKSQEDRPPLFYLHGLGGCLDDCPEVNELICRYTTLIRVSCFGTSSPIKTIGWGTFGDICAVLHNARQSVISIADLLNLSSYGILAHSWGGLVASLVALNDVRCKKAMLLCSTPDICDALSQMYALVGLPGALRPLADLFMGKLRVDAENAKFGRSWHQAAWDRISPYGRILNPEIEMLIFNRKEDPVMRRWNVEHFIEYAGRRGIPNIRAEFNSYPDLTDPHEMPPEKFAVRMEQFFFLRRS